MDANDIPVVVLTALCVFTMTLHQLVHMNSLLFFLINNNIIIHFYHIRMIIESTNLPAAFLYCYPD